MKLGFGRMVATFCRRHINLATSGRLCEWRKTLLYISGWQIVIRRKGKMTTWQARLHDRQPEIVVPTYTTLSWLEISTKTRARVDFINRAFGIQPSDLCHVNEPSPKLQRKWDTKVLTGSRWREMIG
ncbi:hypothetical protein GBA52_007257 [Prunus armeniaca]|nr:hypothetical protein GBA52_007257 [Prunus armeniaca]